MSATEVTDGRMRDIHVNGQVGDLRDPYRAFPKEDDNDKPRSASASVFGDLCERPGALPGPDAVTAAGRFRSGRRAVVDMHPRYHISHRETGLRQAGET